MTETRFLKTVTFGGYDKEDVEKRISSLYSRIFELENELRETKLSLEKYKSGEKSGKVNESVLAEERKRLTECQTEKQAMSDEIQLLKTENEEKEKEILNLKYSIAELEQNLSDADMKITSLQAKDDATSFSVVFVEAKKSASMLIENAQKKADDLEANSKKLAENIVAEANNKAAEIVYEAETYAAEMTAEVNNESEKLKHASGNMKALILEDVNKISSEMLKLKAIFEQSEKILSDTKDTIEKDGVPTFRVPEKFTPELPEKPVYEETDYSYNGVVSENTDSNEYHGYYDDDDDNAVDFDDLNAVDILGDDDDDFDLSGLARPTQNNATNKRGVNLDALTKQAEEFVAMSKKSKKEVPSLDEIEKQVVKIDDSKPKKKTTKSFSLDELAEQAAELDDAKPKKKANASFSLDELAKQAAELDEN